MAYGGRPQCQACGICHVCPTGAKASIDLIQIPEAEATGNARVIPDATVLRLEVDGSGLTEKQAADVTVESRPGAGTTLRVEVSL